MCLRARRYARGVIIAVAPRIISRPSVRPTSCIERNSAYVIPEAAKRAAIGARVIHGATGPGQGAGARSGL